jgi:hypothetical protein
MMLNQGSAQMAGQLHAGQQPSGIFEVLKPATGQLDQQFKPRLG